MRTLPLLIVLGGLGSGCSMFRAQPVPVDHPVHSLPSGVVWRDLVSGDGRPARNGDELVLHYSAHLVQGTPIDSSYDRGEPVTFVLGEAPLAGWNEALGGMRVGGKREATLPPDMAYGAEGVDGWIPPNATLVFEFELVDVTNPK